MTSQQERLIAQYIAGDPVEDRLLEECQKDASLLNELAELVVIERLLCCQVELETTDCFAEEVVERLALIEDGDVFATAVAPRLKQRRAGNTSRRIRFAAVAAAAGILIAIVWQLANQQRPVATLTEHVAAQWVGGTLRPPGSTFTRGPVTLSSGYAELEFKRGAKVIFEGPAELEILSERRVRFFRGRMLAHVPEEAIGFRVDTPSSQVVDLGTEFGIHVEEDGVSEVHVLEGRVKARTSANAEFTNLTKDRAQRFELDRQVYEIQSNPSKFLRALPGRSPESPEYLHWPLDEGTGIIANCQGPGVGGTPFPARFKAYGADTPQWSNGRYGAGLYFDGESAYAETEFPGIEGNRPRTVAFWAKVPAEFETNQGFGMISWGSMEASGTAWQLSPNPRENQGPLGRLRAGTNLGQVIGSTDLRDNRWHHLAVVMYGGRQANVATHILLYVDGQLETASSKSVRRIDTYTKSERSRAVVFGRNIRSYNSTAADRFFRGWLDEIFILDAALSQPQIQQLMATNQLEPWASQ